MFTPHSTDPVSFPSIWKKERSSVTGSCQTSDLVTKDEESQVVQFADSSAQTEEEKPPESGEAKYDEDSLLTFLRRISPKVEEELEKIGRSRAFDSYSQLEDEAGSDVRPLHVLRWPQLFSEGLVTCLDWSSTGSVIGVSYGAESHEDWCKHKGAIAIWNISRNDFSANQPEQVIEISSCVTGLAFHPTNPAILAVGAMSGEIFIYDLSRSEDVTPVAVEESNGGSITNISWVSAVTTSGQSTSRTHYSLITTTSAGAVLIWDYQFVKETLTLTQGYLLMAEDIPRSGRPRVEESGGVGIATITFNNEDPTLFVLGAEGGAVVLCSTLHQIHSGVKYGSVSLCRCVTSNFTPHTGRVLTTQSSRHHRNALLTLASDNQLRLYSLLQPNKPVSVIFSKTGLSCTQWLPSRPLVVAAGTVTGEVIFFHFGTKNWKPIVTLPAAEKPSSISTISFNNKDLTRVAVGDALGRVTIWQLSNNIVSPSPTEHSSLTSLVNTLDE